MKKILIGLLALGSISAFAEICEIRPTFDPEANKITLHLEDKESVSTNDELVTYITNGLNNKNLDCIRLISEIKKSGLKTAVMEGNQIPIQLVLKVNL